MPDSSSLQQQVVINQELTSKKRKETIDNSVLILFAFSSAFFPRLLETLGAPAPINFLHFVVVPFVFYTVLVKSRSKDRNQVQLTQQLLFALLFFLAVILTSAIANNAGAINAFLSFMLLGEPFIMIIAIISIPMAPQNFQRFRKFIIGACFFHIALALIQRYILRYDLVYTGMEGVDNIQGVFYLSGAGHVVGTSVSLSFAIYYLVTAKSAPIWFRVFVAIAAFTHMLAADGKQVLFAMLVGWGILFLTKLKDIGEAIKYLALGAVTVYVLLWCMQNLEAFAAFNVWMRPELYGPSGEVTLLKTSAFRIIPTYYESPLNWLLGLGPGHTVGRLGGWMLKDYESLLSPLGSTIHPASSAVWRAVGASYWGDKSSMFSPLFGWAGIWGDLGLLGLGAYLFLAFLVWQYVCPDDVSRFLMMTVVVFGLIFSQMEEPGYMMTIAAFIGLRWQENQYKERQKKQEEYQRLLNQGI